MTGKLSSLLILAPALLLGQDGGLPEAPLRHKLSVSSVLEPNSVLTGVILPRYDKDLRLLSVLRAKSVTLVGKDVLDGKAVNIRLYQADQRPRGRMDLVRARYDQVLGEVRATGETKLVFDRMITTASGLIFIMDSGEGFLTGPVTTRISQPPATVMNPRTLPFHAAVLLGTTLLSPSLAAESGLAPAHGAADSATRTDLRKVLEASAEATRAATAFLESEDLLAQATPVGITPPPVPQALEVKPGPDDTVISCDGGTYVDGNKGILVYLGNVTVSDPRFSMTGANELKIFFTKKPGKPGAKPAAPDKEEIKPGVLPKEDFEIERIVATGAVYFKQKPKDGEDPIEASGAVFTYDVKTEAITLSGGQPWVRRGGLINRAKQANQTITIVNNTATFSPGGTETILPGKDLQKRKPR